MNPGREVYKVAGTLTASQTITIGNASGDDVSADIASANHHEIVVSGGSVTVSTTVPGTDEVTDATVSASVSVIIDKGGLSKIKLVDGGDAAKYSVRGMV